MAMPPAMARTVSAKRDPERLDDLAGKEVVVDDAPLEALPPSAVQDDVRKEQRVDQHDGQDHYYGGRHPPSGMADRDHRHPGGGRSGARVGPAGPQPSLLSLIGPADRAAGPLAGGTVEGRVGDGALLYSPLVQDLLVLAVGHDGLHGRQQRCGQAAALGDGKAIRCRLERGARQLELAVREVDYVRRHLGIGEAEVGATIGDSQVDLVLVGIAEDVDLAPLGLALGVGLLGCAGLDGHRMPAQGLEAVERLGAVGLLVKAFAGLEVVDEVDHLLPRLGVGERGVADVELAVLDARDDGVERGVHEGDLDAQDLAQGHRPGRRRSRQCGRFARTRPAGRWRPWPCADRRRTWPGA